MAKTRQISSAEDARRLSRSAHKRAQKNADADHEKKRTADEKLRADMRKEARRILPDVLKEIEVQANADKTSATHQITVFGAERIENYDWYLAAELKKLLEGKGFSVRTGDGKDEPFGSDPMFDHTVYSLWLEISWEPQS